MFDSVGKQIDAEAGKRRVAALLLTLGLSASVAGIAFAYAAWMAARIILDEIKPDEDMIEVVMDDPAMEDELPPPPPPPPPPAGADTPDEEETPEPETMSEEVAQLDETVKEEVKDDAGGAEGGVEGGEEGGVVGGVVGGVEGGELGGVLGGVRVFHHSEVRVKRRVQPQYPDAAKDLNLGEVTCRIRIFIDEEGVPYDVQIENCPKVFNESATEALFKWRWYPAEVEGHAVKAQFLMAMKYIP